MEIPECTKLAAHSRPHQRGQTHGDEPDAQRREQSRHGAQLAGDLCAELQADAEDNRHAERPDECLQIISQVRGGLEGRPPQSRQQQGEIGAGRATS